MRVLLPHEPPDLAKYERDERGHPWHTGTQQEVQVPLWAAMKLTPTHPTYRGEGAVLHRGPEGELDQRGLLTEPQTQIERREVGLVLRVFARVRLVVLQHQERTPTTRVKGGSGGGGTHGNVTGAAR